MLTLGLLLYLSIQTPSHPSLIERLYQQQATLLDQLQDTVDAAEDLLNHYTLHDLAETPEAVRLRKLHERLKTLLRTFRPRFAAIRESDSLDALEAWQVDLLAQLQSLRESPEETRPDPLQQRAYQRGRALDQVESFIRRQRALLEAPRDGASSPAEEQARLADDVQDLMLSLAEHSPEVGEALQKARQSMQLAERALRRGSRDKGKQRQREAVEALEQANRRLRQLLAESKSPESSSPRSGVPVSEMIRALRELRQAQRDLSERLGQWSGDPPPAERLQALHQQRSLIGQLQQLQADFPQTVPDLQPALEAMQAAAQGLARADLAATKQAMVQADRELAQVEAAFTRQQVVVREPAIPHASASSPAVLIPSVPKGDASPPWKLDLAAWETRLRQAATQRPFIAAYESLLRQYYKRLAEERP